LPQVQGEGRMPLRQVAFTNQMMAQVFGLHTTVLRYLDRIGKFIFHLP
jgi:hypothetical protein